MVTTQDKVFREGVEWIAKNVYRLDIDPNDFCFDNTVQMLSMLANTTPAWIVQCVDRCARNKSY